MSVSTRCTFYADAELAAKLKATSDATGAPLSEVIRRALVKGVDSATQPKQPLFIDADKRKWVSDAILTGHADQFLVRWTEEIMNTDAARILIGEALALCDQQAGA